MTNFDFIQFEVYLGMVSSIKAQSTIGLFDAILQTASDRLGSKYHRCPFFFFAKLNEFWRKCEIRRGVDWATHLVSSSGSKTSRIHGWGRRDREETCGDNMNYLMNNIQVGSVMTDLFLQDLDHFLYGGLGLIWMACVAATTCPAVSSINEWGEWWERGWGGWV